jgi:hypothetical protein
MVTKMFFNMVDKTNEIYVIPTLAHCITCTCSFSLWMFCVGFDTFVTVVNFINVSWEPCHVTIKVFWGYNIISVAIANQVKSLLNSFNLLDKIIAYIKDERSNLNILTFALTSIVSYFVI